MISSTETVNDLGSLKMVHHKTEQTNKNQFI